MISDRIARARKASGLSLRQLGPRVGLSHAAIKKYEDGVVVPSSDLLLRLAKALGVRTEYFFRPQTLALSRVDYRKRSLPARALAAIEHQVLDMVERRLDLEGQFPQPPVPAFRRPAGLPATIESPEEVEATAEKLRAAWKLGCDPIPDLVDVVEAHGIRVYLLDDSQQGKFDVLCAQVEGYPVVVVGKSWPGDRQRFTLAHELGHLLLASRLADDIDAESAADRFAGAFLLPKSALIQAMGVRRTAIELRELALLKAEFGVSMQGIIYRLRDLGIIDEAQRAALFRMFTARGWRKTEPGAPYPQERAHGFEQLVFRALAEDYIGESKAAELMGLPLDRFRQLRALEAADVAAG